YHNVATLGDFSQPEGNAEATDFAAKLNISFKGADDLLAALKGIQLGEFERVSELGLSQEDIVRVGQLQLPTDEGLQNMAKNLELSVGTTRNAIDKFVTLV